MKKIIRTFILLVTCMLFAAPAEAQLKFGIKGGINLSKGDFNTVIDASVESLEAKSYTGFFIGPTAQLNIPIINLGVEGSLLFNHSGTKYTYSNGALDTTTGSSIDGTNTQNALEIPINLRYNIGLGSIFGIYFAAGPSFKFDIGDKDGFSKAANFVVTSKWKNQEVAINLGGGLRLLKHLEVGLNYRMPLTNSAKDNISGTSTGTSTLLDPGSYKNKTWQVSAAYIF
jgi:hypothetical protein